MTRRDAEFAALIRSVTACRQQAERLGCPFLADLLGAAVLEAALQAEGGRDGLGDDRKRLETLLAMKIRTALAGGNVVAIRKED